MTIMAIGEEAGNGAPELGSHSSSSPPFTFPSSEESQVPILLLGEQRELLKHSMHGAF